MSDFYSLFQLQFLFQITTTIECLIYLAVDVCISFKNADCVQLYFLASDALSERSPWSRGESNCVRVSSAVLRFRECFLGKGH